MRDGIFADSLDSERASVTGNPSSGYAATFIVGLAAQLIWIPIRGGIITARSF